MNTFVDKPRVFTTRETVSTTRRPLVQPVQPQLADDSRLTAVYGEAMHHPAYHEPYQP